MVEYEDGAVIAQMGTPDMRLPILYAMSWPERLATGGQALDWSQIGALTFEAPDTDKFPALNLAYAALKAGGTAAAVMNGANEAAVQAFLEDRICFGRIAQVVEETMQRISVVHSPSLEEVFEADQAARAAAQELLA